ncbi:MAG TPA: FG-GAP-like repeat-containing protein, partial [Puia sp.]|nr:FG-GAP-like repeat-containing protein [Puia sp.]
LDNDGDLDLVVNTIDQPALIYENHCNDKQRKRSLDISLKGPDQNRRALGAKLILFAGQQIRTSEKYPVRGFLSSMDIPLHIGLDQTTIDSAFLVWPDNSFQRIAWKAGDSTLTLAWQKGLPKFDYRLLTEHWKNPARPMKDITTATGLLWKHEENSFHEFDREPLIPHMLSTEGPALAVGDADRDGRQDVFIGSSKWKISALFRQTPAGRFIRLAEPALDADSTYEDVGACWTDVNNDGNQDLVVASGGNEFYGQDSMLSPRVYLGDGKGGLKRLPHAFDQLYVNASCVAPLDFNGDGYVDLFIGARSVPFEYGKIPRSYLLQNDGQGHFTDVTSKYATGLENIGFVTQALWSDIDKDGRKDLIISLEWGGIIAWMNHGNALVKKTLTDKKGWWNFVLPVDIDNDGDIDLIAGNLGLNSRLKASPQQPVRLYYYD